jgi:hypothetical protein
VSGGERARAALGANARCAARGGKKRACGGRRLSQEGDRAGKGPRRGGGGGGGGGREIRGGTHSTLWWRRKIACHERMQEVMAVAQSTSRQVVCV